MSRRVKKHPNLRETKDDKETRDSEALDPLRIWTEDLMCPRPSNSALFCFQQLIECNNLTSNDEKALVERIIRWLKCELTMHTFHNAYLNVVATQNAQLVKLKALTEMEKGNTKMLNRLSSVKESVRSYWGTVDLFDDVFDRLSLKDANLSRWRRDTYTFKRQVSTVGNSARKDIERMEMKTDNAFSDILELCWWYSDGLHYIDFVGGEQWTETEERRLRSGLYFFGRDWRRVAEYVRLNRIVPRQSAHDPKLKSKVQKFLVLYRKCALPLPASVLTYGTEYTLKGVDPLENGSQLWTKIIVDVQTMLPIEDAPFGRRAFRTPNEPLFIEIED